MNAKFTLFNRVLPEFKASSPYFTTAAIARRVQELDLEIKESTLPVYLTEATASGIIHDAGRGLYSSLAQEFKLDTKPLAPLVRNLIQSARRGVSSVIDTFQVMTNFEIGRRIVEHEQKGERRAGYGKELLKGLSVRLTEEFGRGFSEDNLARMRAFYVTWNERVLEFPRSLRGNPPSP